LTVMLCPLCHKAEPIVKTEYCAVGSGPAAAVAVTLGFNVCGRCGHSVAMAAINAASLHVSALRKKTK
jgi:hypothetical protein